MDSIDIQNLQIVLQPIISFFTALVLSGAATSTLTEVMKNQFIPIPAQRYPRITAAINSLIATGIAIFVSPMHFVLENWWQVGAFGIGVWYVAAKLYNEIIKRSTASGA